MIELDWVGDKNEATCEHGHLCAWVQQLAVDERYVWMIDTPGEEDKIINLAVGISDALNEAKLAVAHAMAGMHASPRGSWSHWEDSNVVEMHRANRPPLHDPG